MTKLDLDGLSLRLELVYNAVKTRCLPAGLRECLDIIRVGMSKDKAWFAQRHIDDRVAELERGLIAAGGRADG